MTVDAEANAGYVAFAQAAVAKTLPVYDEGEVVATLSFSDEGVLLGIELLCARKQIPGAFEKPG